MKKVFIPVSHKTKIIVFIPFLSPSPNGEGDVPTKSGQGVR